MTIFVASVLIALSISCLCSLMEATLLSLTPTQVAEMSRKHPRMGRIWSRFKANIEQPIAVILILNTTAHTIGASIAGAQFDKLWGTEWIWLFGLIFTYLMLQFTEILPKTIGVQQNHRLALVIGRPLSLGILLFRPVIWLIHVINRPFERRSDGRQPKTLEEITALAGLARLSREINFHQERIIRGASRLSQMQATEVMIPVEQVSFLSTPQSLAEALVTAHLDLHTRYPVIAGDDHNQMLGYVNFKEIVTSLKTNPQNATLEGIIRPVHFVVGGSPAADLLRSFVDGHVHIAIVRDDDGRTLGLVTLEDLLEELVGELEDEFDRMPRYVHELSGGTLLVGGGVPMRELAQRLDGGLPDEPVSIADWIARQDSDETPLPGSVHRCDGLSITVRRTRRGKAFEVAISKTA